MKKITGSYDVLPRLIEDQDNLENTAVFTINPDLIPITENNLENDHDSCDELELD